MGKLSKIIKDYKDKHHLSQEEFALRCNLSKAYIGFIINEKDPSSNRPPKPSMETLKKLAMGMDMNLKELLLKLENHSMYERAAIYTYYVPVVEKRSDIMHFITGEPFVNIEQIGLEMVPEYAYKDKNTVAIRINDDTLSPEIRRGDTAIVWMNEPLTNGDFVLTITQRSEDLRCYRYRMQINGNSIILYGNLSVKPLEYSPEITILGKVVRIQKDL